MRTNTDSVDCHLCRTSTWGHEGLCTKATSRAYRYRNAWDERLGISASYQGTTSRYCRHWYQRLFGWRKRKKIRSTMVRCVLCDYSKRNSHDSTGSNHRKSHWKWRGCVVGGEEHKLHAAFRQGITDHCQLCERIHHFHYCTPTEYQRSIGKDICTTSFREAPCS